MTPTVLSFPSNLRAICYILIMPLLQNTSSTNKYYLLRPSRSTQPPPAHAHSTATSSCTHFLYTAFGTRLSPINIKAVLPKLPLLPSSPSCLYSEVRMSTLISGTTPPFGHTSTSCIHSQYNYLHVFPTQLTHKCRPFNLHPAASIYTLGS